MTLNAQTQPYEEPFRPQYHFSPDVGWLNDPNGLVYYQGEYHLFFQYYPNGTTWNTMHWGHAVSADLVHWTQLPIALSPDANGPIFSGSAVVDDKNTSGLVPGGGLIAIFSYANQTQGIAYSTDKGRNWTMYAGNPVLLNPGPTNDFRDPKVFWYAPSGKWMMVIAASDRARIYTSPDLIQWAFASEFGDQGGAHGGVWECPDLFPLKVDGNTRWVMLISIGEGAVNGGSGTQYFIGDFDGTTFTSENPGSATLWLDYGTDNYAGVTWNDTPDNSRLLIGWMNNWRYANKIPTSTWRGALTIPRRLQVRTIPGQGNRLVQAPIVELGILRGQHKHLENQSMAPGHNLLADERGQTLEIIAEFEMGTAAEIGFKLFVEGTQQTTVGYNEASSILFVDRTQSGEVDFSDAFPGRFQAPLSAMNGQVKLHVFVDRSSVEVFGEGGAVVITSQIFPGSESSGLELFSSGGTATLLSMDVYHLYRALPAAP